MIKKANIVSEPISTDPTQVKYKNPQLHYVWAKNNDEVEMMDMAAKGYIPATGKEKIVRNPFENVQEKEGDTKIRGNRILMCCPKSMVQARRAERSARHQTADKAAKSDARKMSAGQSGFTVTGEATVETARETIKEEKE